MSDDEDQIGPIYAGELHTGAPKPPKSRRRIWMGFVALMTFVGLVLGTLIVFGMKFADGPSTGAVISASVGPSPSASVAPGEGLAQLDGAYFTMKYPASFDNVSHLPDDHIFFEKYNLSSQSNYKKLITVTVHRTEYGLDDDSDFRSRQLRHFQAVAETLRGDRVVTMISPVDTERTLFWVHNDMLLEISMTSTSTRDDIEAAMAQTKPSIRWKK